MEGNERALLAALPGTAKFTATFWSTSGLSIGGRLLTETGQPIVLGAGTTVVADPVFHWATTGFTDGVTAYSIRRVFLALTVFVIAEFPELEFA
jgi:hypothetical protein